VGAASGARVHQPGAIDIDDAERDRQVGREDVWQNAPVVLEARGITKSFGGIVAAEDLDFDLRRGTITALVGPNGAGKTTAFNLLTGFIRPDRGSVKLNGTELVGLSHDKVARLGLVRSFQNVRLFNRISCVQNVMLAVQSQPGENVQADVRRNRAEARSARPAKRRWGG
jgi:branched-chain amino acid transport system permease protein